MRTDEKKRSVGEFVREEITGPLGVEEGAFFGKPPESMRKGGEKEERQLTRLRKSSTVWGIWSVWGIFQRIVPRFLNGSKAGLRSPLSVFLYFAKDVVGDNARSIASSLAPLFFSLLRCVVGDGKEREKEKKEEEKEEKKRRRRGPQTLSRESRVRSSRVPSEELQSAFRFGKFQEGEIPSASMRASARGMAAVAAAFCENAGGRAMRVG